jgi:hypothetical protein
MRLLLQSLSLSIIPGILIAVTYHSAPFGAVCVFVLWPFVALAMGIWPRIKP